VAKSANLAYNAVRLRILDSRYPPEFHLREGAIAAELGISRTPVRDALRRLAAEGYVTLSPNKGAFVTNVSDASLSDLISVRAELAALAAQGVPSNAAPNIVEEMADIVRKMSRIEDDPAHKSIDAQTRLNMRFHELIFANCGNSWLGVLLRQTSNIASIQRAYFAYTAADWKRSVSRYAEIIEAIRVGDGAWAAAAFKAHFLASRNAIIKRKARRR
jgi:DNA-binding GntR family transcriptional regulator